MKIVFLAPFGIRPKGTVIARMVPLAAELQKLGHSVEIVAPPYTNPEDSGKTETYRGVDIKNIHVGIKNKIAATLVYSLRMYKIALQGKPDVVHLFKPKGYGGFAVMMMIVLRRLGFRVPAIIVDTDDWEGKGGMNFLHRYSLLERLVFQFQEELLLARGAAVTVASRTLQTKVWGMGVPSEQVHYLPNCVEEGRRGNGAAIRQKLGIPLNAPVLLLYTRFFEFSQDKLHYLFAEIYRGIPKARFLVVGKGRMGEEEHLVSAASRLGFADALFMPGWVEAVEIPDYLAAGDVAIYPFSDTLVNRAKCPAKATELLSAGIPVVADGVGQLSEYVKHEVSGIICEPENWQEMADRAVELLNDLERSKKLGEAGRRYILDRFSWREHACTLQALYQKVTQQSC